MVIGICGDTGHWTRSGVTPAQALRLFKGRIFDIHLKDLNEFGKSEATDVPFGKGVSGVRDILAELSLQNYHGTITIEHEKEEDSMNESEDVVEHEEDKEEEEEDSDGSSESDVDDEEESEGELDGIKVVPMKRKKRKMC